MASPEDGSFRGFPLLASGAAISAKSAAQLAYPLRESQALAEGVPPLAVFLATGLRTGGIGLRRELPGAAAANG
jgi:hypothetical protein